MAQVHSPNIQKDRGNREPQQTQPNRGGICGVEAIFIWFCAIVLFVCVWMCADVRVRERENLRVQRSSSPPARSHTRNVIIIKYPPALAVCGSLSLWLSWGLINIYRAESNSACAFRSRSANVQVRNYHLSLSRRSYIATCATTRVSARSFVACVAFIGNQSVRAQ